TAFGAQHLRTLAANPAGVRLLYHGLDLDRFAPTPEPGEARDGSDPDRPVRLLSVGRAVEKKGFDVLLAALARLPASLHWRLTHLGGGPLRPALERQATDLGLAARIDWRGAAAQAEVLDAYRASD